MVVISALTGVVRWQELTDFLADFLIETGVLNVFERHRWVCRTAVRH